jgi:hypothetical protein
MIPLNAPIYEPAHVYSLLFRMSLISAAKTFAVSNPRSRVCPKIEFRSAVQADPLGHFQKFFFRFSEHCDCMRAS